MIWSGILINFFFKETEAWIMDPKSEINLEFYDHVL